MKTVRAEGSAGPNSWLSDAFLWTQPFVPACVACSSRGDALGASAAPLT